MGVPGILLLVLLDEQARATQRLGILTRGAFLEGCEHAVLMRAHGANGQRLVTPRDLQARPGGKNIRVVAAHVENDLAAQAVGRADDSGCELHEFSSS